MKNMLPLILTLFIFTSCSKEKGINLSEEKSQILKLHNAQRDYHFNKDSTAFASQFSDSFIGVGNGIVSSSTKEERISRYKQILLSS